MIFVSFSDSFKYFHTADIFAALVRASIWSRHVIVLYSLFGLFAYSAEHRKRFFCYFRPNNFGCRTFGASLVLTMSTCLNALSCRHVIGWLDICINKQLKWCLRKWPVSICCDLKSVIVMFWTPYYHFACNILVLHGIYTVCSMAFLM